MNSILKRVTLWALFLLFATFATALSTHQPASAANITGDFINFISKEHSLGPSQIQIEDLQVNLAEQKGCYEAGSYRSGAVNKRSGPQAYGSLVNWAAEKVTDKSAQTKANDLIKSLYNEVDGGMILGYRDTEGGDSQEGWCSYIVRMAEEAKIPITADAVTVTDETNNKSSAISAIGNNCTTAFGNGSKNLLALPSQITSFLNSLSDADYNALVEPQAGSIKGGGAGASSCDTLVANLKPKIDTYVASECEKNPEAEGCVDTSGQESPSSCAIDGIGWILCPAVNALAGFADGAFTIISDGLLRTDVKIVSTSSPSYEVWSIMRSIANVVFVIIFLLIIFSQLTGMGITNYGVKKMLPRLVVAAILVNISFFICQIAVDISNILGYSINDALRGVSTDIADLNASADGVSPFATGTNFSDLAVGILIAGAGAALVYALLSVFIPVILAAVIALVMILFLLIARQALIVMLIVLSPLAFVAFLLPNTEKLFTQWRKIFTALLLLFPIIALVFGLSKLASTIITLSFSGDLGDGDSNSFFGQIIGAAILVLPLFAVPILLKKSLDSIPVLGQMASKFSGRANGRVGAKLKESYKGSTFARGSAIRQHGREQYRTKKFAERISKGGVIGTANKLMASGIPILGADRAANKALVKSATATNVKALVEEREEAKTFIENANLSGEQRQVLAINGEVTYKDAGGVERKIKGDAYKQGAVDIQLKTGSMGQKTQIIEQSAEGGKLHEHRQLIAQGVVSYGITNNDPAMSGKSIDEITQGKFKLQDARARALAEGKVSAEVLATMHDDARGAYVKMAEESAGAGDSTQMLILKEAKSSILSSPQLRGKISGNVVAESQLSRIP